MPALTAKRRAHAADMGSFLPRYVLRKPKVEMAMPYMEQLTTAVLFADVSGFTKLSEKLAHKGGRGAADVFEMLLDSQRQRLETRVKNARQTIEARRKSVRIEAVPSSPARTAWGADAKGAGCGDGVPPMVDFSTPDGSRGGSKSSSPFSFFSSKRSGVGPHANSAASTGGRSKAVDRSSMRTSKLSRLTRIFS